MHVCLYVDNEDCNDSRWLYVEKPWQCNFPSLALLFSHNSSMALPWAALSPSVTSVAAIFATDNRNEWNCLSRKDTESREKVMAQRRRVEKGVLYVSLPLHPSLSSSSSAMATQEMNADADQRKNWQENGGPWMSNWRRRKRQGGRVLNLWKGHI